MSNAEVNIPFEQLSNPNNAIILPPHVLSANPLFSWGNYDSVSFMHALEDAYTEIAHLEGKKMLSLFLMAMLVKVL